MLKVNVESIEARNQQRDSARFKIKGRRRDGCTGLVNVRLETGAKSTTLNAY
jgi:hypothetical protein